ncbi:chemotaxis protein CheW [Haloplanus aerogenes]|uniref:Chemotaxis protein CheW n=1 Tax=Haloplanus aerogenes TaxID=660522 RepID=A0A3M0DS11_9EURY|nr:chemotaxis protein CheW [Haloplanus aerogenes]AZH25322.1 chemotaxis protein CheW [Haloplanus aerogenes]RMB25018.1 purine-binding chemotaxis protein CheW [Haloplanus aerogenes]
MSETAARARTVQLLEFELGSEAYAVDIAHVAEIVDVNDLTVVPNSAPHVEGVMDLRGKTTTIIDPKTVFGIGGGGDGKRIVVFDRDLTANGKSIGWIVDEVDQVVEVEPDDVESSPVDDADDAVRGVIKRDGDFVIWVRPTVLDV